jgi:hypothetical protein
MDKHEEEDRIQSEISETQDAYEIISAITVTTTPQDFEKILKQHPKYKLECGGRCGWNIVGVAAARGNIELLKYILSLRRDLVNLENDFGWTPLFCVIHRSEGAENMILEKVKLLVEHGANISLATTASCGDSRYGRTPEGLTPLEAAEKKRYSSIVEYLKEFVK